MPEMRRSLAGRQEKTKPRYMRAPPPKKKVIYSQIARVMESCRKMPYYVVLVKLTDKGRQNAKQGWTQDRPKVKAQVQKMGGKMTGYLTFGQYDFVELLELPDDKAAARFALMAGATGLVSTVTLKAFSEDEVDKMVQELP